MTTPLASSWAPYRKPPTDHKSNIVKLNFFPDIEKYGKFKFDTGIFNKPKFEKPSRTETLSDDNLIFELANWPPPLYKYDKSKFEKVSGVHPISKYNKLKYEGARDYPKNNNYDKSKLEKMSGPHFISKYNKLMFKGGRDYPKKYSYDTSKFEKVSGSIFFVKDIDMRPQAMFNLDDLKCHNRDRNGFCVSYVQKKQNIATMSPVNNKNGDILRTPFTYDYQDPNDNYYNDDDNVSNKSHEDLTRVSGIQDRAHGNVSEDYIDVSNKLLIREQGDVKPKFKFDHDQQKQLLIELENALRKPPVITARKFLSHKNRKKRKGLRKTKKTNLNITFTPLKYYRAVQSDESDSDDDSDSDDENDAVTITIVKAGTINIVETSDESIDEPVTVNMVPILKKGKKNKRNRFSVIDNEKKKAKHKKKFKAKQNSNEVKDSDSAGSSEKRNEPYEYKSDESYGSSEKLSIENHAQSREYTTLKPKKKKKKKSKIYMYMQGQQRQYTDSEEGSRRSVKVLRHRVDNHKNNALQNNDKNNRIISKKRVSEDYIDYENYRRFIPKFLPKRYFWSKDELLDLGYFWFNGPQGHVPGPYQINY